MTSKSKDDVGLLRKSQVYWRISAKVRKGRVLEQSTTYLKVALKALREIEGDSPILDTYLEEVRDIILQELYDRKWY